jgi:Arc/MetJ-type ribon-helix-helix transcriptional regulator
MSTTDRDARLASRFAPALPAPPAPPPTPVATIGAGPAPVPPAALYRRGSVYLTTEQRDWLKSMVHVALGEGLNLSASDFIRLALDRLRQETTWEEMRPTLIDRAYIDAQTYPGRAKRGLPPRED